jgi:hypothetical protein
MGVSVVSMTHNETEKLPNGTIKLIKVKQFIISFEKILFPIKSSSLLNLIGHLE